MTLLNKLLNITLLFYIYNFISNIYFLKKVNNWLRKERNINEKNISSNTLYLLIPVLNEQKIIRETVQHFYSIVEEFKNVYVIFITTNKEIDQVNSTYKLIRNLIVEKRMTNIRLINYPSKNGVMAHQLNYGLKFIKENFEKKVFWVGIYNADSRINRGTILYILSKIKDGEECVYQQYSYYPLPKGQNKKSIIGSASLWQTRWSINFEIYRVLFQLKLSFYLKKINNTFFKILVESIFEKMNYVIGHGFFSRSDILEKVGEFSETTINEDAILGYLLNCNRILIKPIPYFERADFAPNLLIYIRQQAVWFNGPLYAYNYFKIYLLKRTKNNFYENLRALILATKLFLMAFYWLVSPILLLIILPYYIDCYKVLLSLIFIIILNLPLIHKYIKNSLKDISECDYNSLANPSVIYCTIFYLLHSVGPILCIIKIIFRKNTIKNKYKTER